MDKQRKRTSRTKILHHLESGEMSPIRISHEAIPEYPEIPRTRPVLKIWKLKDFSSISSSGKRIGQKKTFGEKGE